MARKFYKKEGGVKEIAPGNEDTNKTLLKIFSKTPFRTPLKLRGNLNGGRVVF